MGWRVCPWNEGGMWGLGSRCDQNIVAIDVKSLDNGQILNGTITYNGEGAISFRAKRSESNNYMAENQWGGDSADWHADGTWVIGSRSDQNIVAIDVKSLDGGQTLNGTITYNGEGAIGFKGVEVPNLEEGGLVGYRRFEHLNKAGGI